MLKKEAELGLGGTLVSGTDTQGSYNASSMVTYGQGPSPSLTEPRNGDDGGDFEQGGGLEG